MRIRILNAPSGSVDGIDLSKFLEGGTYEVGTLLGNYLIASGNATAVADSAPVLVLPLDHPIAERIGPRLPLAEAAERFRKPRIVRS